SRARRGRGSESRGGTRGGGALARSARCGRHTRTRGGRRDAAPATCVPRPRRTARPGGGAGGGGASGSGRRSRPRTKNGVTSRKVAGTVSESRCRRSTLPADLGGEGSRGARASRRSNGGNDAPGGDARGPDRQLDTGRGRLAARGEQDGRDPARLGLAVEVLRARGPLPTACGGVTAGGEPPGPATGV